MSFREENLAALARRPFMTGRGEGTFITSLSPAPPDLELEFSPARSGQITLRYKGQAVHSLYDPIKEAEKALEEFDDSRIDAFVFIGFGLAYTADAVRRRFPGRPIFLIEPDAALFSLCLDQISLVDLINDDAVRFFVESSGEPIINALKRLPSSASLRIIANRVLAGRSTEYYAALQETLSVYTLRKRVNLNTLEKYGSLWMRNLTRNLPLWSRTPGINRLDGLFAGYPALLLAAGPSLTEILPGLNELRKRALIVCVDTAARIVKSAGIEPDFIVAVDSQYWNGRHLDGLKSDTSIMVADCALYPSALRPADAFKRFFCDSIFPLGKELADLTEHKGELKTGGSVATGAADLCKRLGASEIWCAGVDLGYPPGAPHARGALFEEWALADATRTKSAQNFVYEQNRAVGSYPYPASRGGTVLTDKRMEVYRLWFEEFAETLPCRNLSAGVLIKNMSVAEPEALLALPDVRERLDAILLSARSIQTDERELSAKMASALLKIVGDFRELAALCDEAVSLTKKLVAAKDAKIFNRTLARLSAIDDALSQDAVKESLSFLLEPFIARFIRSQQNATDARQAVQESGIFYQELRRESRFYLDLLRSALAEEGVANVSTKTR